MAKNHFIACAQVIESGFAIGSASKPVLWAPAVAGKTDLAFAAISRERVLLECTETALPG